MQYAIYKNAFLKHAIQLCLYASLLRLLLIRDLTKGFEAWSNAHTIEKNMWLSTRPLLQSCWNKFYNMAVLYTLNCMLTWLFVVPCAAEQYTGFFRFGFSCGKKLNLVVEMPSSSHTPNKTIFRKVLTSEVRMFRHRRVFPLHFKQPRSKKISIVAAAASEPEANERGSSLISRRLLPL